MNTAKKSATAKPATRKHASAAKKRAKASSKLGRKVAPRKQLGRARLVSVTPLVSVIMGSKSDWPTMKLAIETLKQFAIPCEYRIVSAHRTPDLMFEYASKAKQRGIRVIIAAAGGAAHLPGMVAAKTILPVLGVPIRSHTLNGIDSLLSIVQMPAGVPVGTLAIGEAGAKNAALLAARILATIDQELASRLDRFTEQQTKRVLGDKL